ncbi:hypothetical protein BC834DRAFT_905621 [Gloeopeniophorella convolvens]|nr:hypothetical protein BC834DRAFT_905621 [Gloeopeniophorella convolvens]
MQDVGVEPTKYLRLPRPLALALVQRILAACACQCALFPLPFPDIQYTLRYLQFQSSSIDAAPVIYWQSLSVGSLGHLFDERMYRLRRVDDCLRAIERGLLI